MDGFQTDAEYEAFEDFIKQPESAPGASIQERMAWAWCAARDYFDKPTTGNESQEAQDAENRTTYRLSILSIVSGMPRFSGDVNESVLGLAKKYENWVFGKETS